ncbi:MAG: hypothetical protein KUG79_08415 [Pseudomonadales bacterium]|nr:hypothetical protein [Pseudomonadales bacterium]
MSKTSAWSEQLKREYNPTSPDKLDTKILAYSRQHMPAAPGWRQRPWMSAMATFSVAALAILLVIQNPGELPLPGLASPVGDGRVAEDFVSDLVDDLAADSGNNGGLMRQASPAAALVAQPRAELEIVAKPGSTNLDEVLTSSAVGRRDQRQLAAPQVQKMRQQVSRDSLSFEQQKKAETAYIQQNNQQREEAIGTASRTLHDRTLPGRAPLAAVNPVPTATISREDTGLTDIELADSKSQASSGLLPQSERSYLPVAGPDPQLIDKTLTEIHDLVAQDKLAEAAQLYTQFKQDCRCQLPDSMAQALLDFSASKR